SPQPQQRRPRHRGHQGSDLTGRAGTLPAPPARSANTATSMSRRGDNAMRSPPDSASVHTAAAAGKAPTAPPAPPSRNVQTRPRLVGWTTQALSTGQRLGAHRSGGRKNADRPTQANIAAPNSRAR